MSVQDGQPISASVSNPSWISKNIDDTTPSKLGLANTAPESGTSVTNTQTELNAIDSFTGNPINSLKNNLPVWTNNDVGSSSDNLKVRADALTQKFNASTGHKHTGAAGDAPNISSGDIVNVTYKGYVFQGTDLTSITGGSTNVSSYLTGKSPSTSPSMIGVVVNVSNNRIIIRDGNNLEYKDAFGNIVYGRLTYAIGVWTLTYYTNVSGTETAYSFASSSIVRWYYQEIFNPLSVSNPPPVYSEFASIPSDNVTADIIQATTTEQGKVNLATVAQSIASLNAAGTPNARVANADHTHQGVHSVAASGDPQLYGDVTYTGSNGTTLNQVGQNIDISSPALSTATPQDVGSSGNAGSATTSSKSDHVHRGVHSVAGSGDAALYGDVTFTGSNGTTLNQVGQNIDFSSPALGTATPQDVGSTGNAGSGTTSSKVDHVHKGVHSVAASGNPALYGDVTWTATNGASLNQVGQNIAIDAPALSSSTPQDVGSTGNAGSASTSSKSDHVHKGLHSIAASGDPLLYGDVTLSAGTNISLNQVGQNIAISSTGGSGGGGGMPNLLLKDSSYADTQTDNQNFDTTIGTWVAYADAAGTRPVDMTGGSPNTTIARTTSTPLDGAGSALMTINSGASRQGEGVSTLVYVPPGFRGQNVQFNFPFATTGSLVEDDFKAYAYIIDGASAGVVTPFWQSKILGTQGVCQSVFAIPTDCTQLRVGIHIARTSTGAVTIKCDDVYLTNVIVPVGLAGGDTQTYTLTIGGSVSAPTKGTVSRDQATYRRSGDKLQIHYEYAQTGVGSSGSGTYLFPLPAGLSIDSSKLITDTSGNTADVGSATAFSELYGVVKAYNSTNLVLKVFNNTHSPDFIGSGTYGDLGTNATMSFSFDATVPIAGWSSNVQMANSAQFNISSYLASGTRVTGSAPTQLGQYRSYLRNSSANTFTETNGTPTTTPTNADGILIYQNTAWGTVNSNNQPTKYDIFVGKNKSIKWAFYKSSGRTGSVDITPSQFTSTVLTGYATSYDPTTGIATIVAPANSSSTSASNTGIDETGAEITSSVYFDIVVSENALAVGVEAPIELFVRMSTSSSISTSFADWTAWQSIITDNYSAFNTGTGIFTAPRSGFYHFDVQFVDAGTTNLIGSRLLVNGTTKTETYALGSSGTISAFLSYSISIYLNNGDQVKLQFSSNNSSQTSSSVSERLWFSAHSVQL